MTAFSDRKKILKRLAKKYPSILNKIRQIWLDCELDAIDCDDYYGSEREHWVRKEAKRLSAKRLLDFWEEGYDCGFEVMPKKAIKELTDAEKEILDLN